MATMKDGARLELLKEIGGTHVYEERRKESVKLLSESEARCGARVCGSRCFRRLR